MVDAGLKDAGYEYIVIGDMWSLKERDENGRLQPGMGAHACQIYHTIWQADVTA